MVALAFGQEAAARALLEAGAGVNAGTGQRPLHAAAKKGMEEMVRELVGKGAEWRSTRRRRRAWRRWRLRLRALLEAGAGVNAGTGQRPVHAAAEKGMEEMVRELVDKGAEVDAEDGEGRTALTVAHGTLNRSGVLSTQLRVFGVDMNAQVEQSEVEAVKRELLVAAQAASSAAQGAPCHKCGGVFPETWDMGQSFHCYDCKTALPEGRKQAELRALRAVVATDTAAECSDEARLVGCGVRVAWLKRFAREVCGLRTFEVVSRRIMPCTQLTRCRYVELLETGTEVGAATVFVSHTWGAKFEDMVAAVGHALPDSAFVWVDIFAVRQWPGNVADLNFRPVVRGTEALLLCATPLDSVAQLRVEDVTYGRTEVPAEARRGCAFFRLWCIVELTAALLAAKPVVMLIGRAAVTSNGDGGCLDFDAQPMMGAALIEMVNIEKAECAVEADRSRELALVKQEPGFDAVNKLARGAIGGAMFSMPHREVLQAACGYMGPLQQQLCGGSDDDGEEPWSLVQVVDALCSSVAGGFPSVFDLLMGGATHLAGPQLTTTTTTAPTDEEAPRMTHHPLDTCGSLERTPLQCAAMYGRAECARRLLALGASANLALRENGGTPLYMAAVNGHVDVAKELLAVGADPNLGLRNGATPLWIAAERGHLEMVKQLVEFGASLNTPHHGGTTPLIEAAHLGRLEVVKELADLGASLDLVAENGASALYMAALAGHHAVVKELAAREAAVNFQGVDTMRWALPNDEAAAAARALQDGQEGEEEAEQVGGVTVPAFCLGELTFSDSGSDEDDRGPTDSDEDDVGEDDEIDKDIDAGIEHLIGGAAGSNADDDSEEDHQDDGDDDDDGDNDNDYNNDDDYNDDDDDDDASMAGDEPEEDSESHQAKKNSILEMLEMSIRSDEQRRENLGKKKNRDVPTTTPADVECLAAARLAAEKGDAPAMQELVSLGMAVDMAGDDGRTLLHLAAAEGHTDVVGVLLGAGAGLDARDRWKQTPLHRAAWNGHQKVAEMLLAKGARVNVSDNDWSTPLHAATFTGHVEIAEALISHGASVKGLKKIRIMAGVDGTRTERMTRLVRRMTRASMMTSPLFVAAAMGHLHTVKELVRAGAAVDVERGRDGVTPLHAAAFSGHVEVVRELVCEMKKAGVDVANVADKDGWTPLRFAARGGNVEVLRELLVHVSSGAVEVAGRDGARPLHEAARAGHAGVVHELVKAGADVEATEKRHGLTALLLAAQSGRAEVVRELVQAGAEVKCVGKQDGLTPLECAVQGGHAEAVHELLAHPMVVDEVARTKSGLTHAHIAARGGHAAVLQELAQAGADVDAPSAPELLTPAHIAAKSGHLEAALTLVTAGAALEKTDPDGRTVLALALASGHDAVSAALLEAGAEPGKCTAAPGAGGLPEAPQQGDQRQKHQSEETRVTKALQRVAERLLKSGWAQVDLRDEDVVRDFLTDLFLDDVEFAAEIGFVAGWSQRLLVSAGQKGTDVYRADLLRGNVSAVLGGALPKRAGGTLLHAAAADGSYFAVARILEMWKRGHVPSGLLEQRDDEGRTPLFCAAQSGHAQVAAALLAAGARRDARSNLRPEVRHLSTHRSASIDARTNTITSAADAEWSDHWVVGVPAAAPSSGRYRYEVEVKLKQHDGLRNQGIVLEILGFGFSVGWSMPGIKNDSWDNLPNDYSKLREMEQDVRQGELNKHGHHVGFNSWSSGLNSSGAWHGPPAMLRSSEPQPGDGPRVLRGALASLVGESITIGMLLDCDENEMFVAAGKTSGWMKIPQARDAARSPVFPAASCFGFIGEMRFNFEGARPWQCTEPTPGKTPFHPIAEAASGNTPVMEAAAGGHMDVCALLLDEADVMDTGRKYQRTLMHWVAWWGHAEVARQILHVCGSHVDCVHALDGQDRPPVWYAAQRGHPEVMRVLIEAGADLRSVVDESGASLAHQAAVGGFGGVLRELVTQVHVVLGAERDTVTLVMQVCEKPAADLNHAAKNGRTPAHSAAAGGHVEALRVLHVSDWRHTLSGPQGAMRSIRRGAAGRGKGRNLDWGDTRL
ncbi:hypothetical protein CYMTET_45249 [Cymbomonas tetramitiformis]|uniref:RING-type E3 ubiquitin transferase n=1 Tax=Cymbomonas tetramitiformis TaxID=36881 RepID=A0AAE0EY78_9CHLO|nr:hypothetical protein CYMTET_45249 [Cymbomonas tetramitiformis]